MQITQSTQTNMISAPFSCCVSIEIITPFRDPSEALRSLARNTLACQG